MNLRSLSSAEMIQLSSEWTTPKRSGHSALVALATTAALVPLVAAAHEAVKAAETALGSDPRAAELAALSAKGVDLDRVHDALVRRIVGMLTAASEGLTNPDDAEKYTNASKAVFPAGLASAQATYKDQAGQALLVDARLDETHKATLASISTPEGTLFDAVVRWKKVAKELGAVDTERTRLAASPTATKGLDIVAARNQWIGAVTALVSILEISRPDDAARTLILAPLEAEVAKAQRRPKPAPSPAPAPAPSPDGPPA